MNVLMISGNSGPAAGKKDSFYYMLKEYQKYWDRVDIISPKLDGAKEMILYEKVYFYPSQCHKLLQPFHIYKVGKQLISKIKYDLIIIHEYAPFYNWLGGILLHFKYKIPYISEFHHIPGLPIAGNFREKLYLEMSKFFVRWIGKFALKVRVVNHQETPKFLEKYGVSKEKIYHLYSFHLNFDSFNPQNEEKKFDLVTCTRLVANKGLHIPINAIKKMKDQGNNLRFLIIGAGPLEKELKNQVKELDLEENVIFWGWAKDADEVGKLFNQSKAFLLTSFAEGGPKTPMEAMACKIPIITTPVGLMREIIVDGENGLVCDWTEDSLIEKINIILNDEEKAKAIADKGFKTIRKFELKEVVKNYAKGYQQFLC